MSDVIRLRFVALGAWPYAPATPVIQWWTGGWPSHVDAVTLDGRLVGAAPFGGVQNRPVAAHPGRAEIVTVPCSLDQRREFWTFLNAHLGQPYDWLGLLGFPVAFHDRRRWFCSELIAAGLHEARLLDAPRPHHHSPASLYRELASRARIIA